MKKYFKKNSRYTFILLMLSAIVAGAILFFKPDKEKIIKVEFLDVDEAYADSIISIMSLEEKVAQIIIYTGNDFSNYNYAGYKIKADSIDQYLQSYKKITENSNIRPFIVNNSNLFLPDFYNNYYNLPSFKTFSSLTDTSIINLFVDFVFKKDSILNYDFYVLPFLESISDSTVTDTLLVNFYENIAFSFLKKFAKQKAIFTIPALSFSADTARNIIVKDIFKQLVSQGLNSVYISDYKQLNSSFYSNFGGVIVSAPEIFNNIEHFFESDIDILIASDSSSNVYDEILKLASRRKFEKLLDEKVKKILLAKTWLNINTPQKQNLQLTKNMFVNIQTDVLIRKITKQSLILLKNNNNLLPFKDINKQTVCLIFSKNNNFVDFSKMIKKYNSADIKIFDENFSEELKTTNIQANKNIVVIIDTLLIDTAFSNKLEVLDTLYNLVVVNINSIKNLELLSNISHLIHVNDTSSLSKNYLAQALYGGIEINSKLPVHVNDSISFQQGLVLPRTRLGYDIPEMVGLSTEKLLDIDSIAQDAIANYVFPGCQVFVAKNGVIVWDESYGYLDYGKSISVKENTLYDIASITKIVGTTLATMKMYDQGKIRLDTKLENYFENTDIDYSRLTRDTSIKNYVVKIDTINILYENNWLKLIRGTDTTWINDSLLVSIDTIKFDVAPRNNIFKVTPRQLLMHQSGISPALPILGLMLIDDTKFDRIRDVYATDTIDSLNTADTLALTYRQKRNYFYTNSFIRDSAEVKVAAGMYLKNAYADSLWEDTKLLKVWHKKVYVYSDVNMILLQIAIDSINNYSISRYLNSSFYNPLGLSHILYKPLNSFSRGNIAPTERETYWRRQLIWGYVHDPSAACLGGVSGNAGLFANAYSLGVIGQMLLNKGSYGGRNFISKSTVNLFTATQPDSYRGLGFDKWSHRQIIAKDASANTFGHTGFTGTCLWVDPDNEIVYVFLSNRVHPSARNWKINKFKIRQKIHQTVYDAMKVCLLKDNKTS